jgi:hypothetical protein
MIIISASDFLPFCIRTSPQAFQATCLPHIRKRSLERRVAHPRAGLPEISDLEPLRQMLNGTLNHLSFGPSR